MKLISSDQHITQDLEAVVRKEKADCERRSLTHGCPCSSEHDYYRARAVALKWVLESAGLVP